MQHVEVENMDEVGIVTMVVQVIVVVRATMRKQQNATLNIAQQVANNHTII